MRGTLAGVLMSIVSAVIVITGLTTLRLTSLDDDQAPVAPTVRSMSAPEAVSGFAIGSPPLCPNYTNNTKYRGVSPREKANNAAILQNSEDYRRDAMPAYIYVTVIQSDGIPVAGVYSAPTPQSSDELFRIPNFTDIFTVC